MRNWLSVELKNNMLFRRIAIIYACTMVTYVTLWSCEYAYSSDLPGGELALVIASIQAPITMLFGYMFNEYNKAKRDGGA